MLKLQNMVHLALKNITNTLVWFLQLDYHDISSLETY